MVHCPSICLSSPLPILVLCNVEWFTLSHVKVTNLFLSSMVWRLALSQIQSSSWTHSVATLSQTQPRLCQPHMCFHLAWSYGSLFSVQLLYWTATISCFLDLNTCFKELITAFDLSSRTDPRALHPHTFGDHFRQKVKIHLNPYILLATLAILVQRFAHVSSSFFFLKRNTSIIASFHHP